MNAILAIALMLMAAGATMVISTVIVANTICRTTMRQSTQQYLLTIGSVLILLGVVCMSISPMG